MTRDRYESADFHRAVDRLTAATSDVDVARLIESDTLFQSPVFHEWLIRSRLPSSQSLWRLLSDYLQLRALVAYRPGNTGVLSQPAAGAHPYLPEYYAALCELIGDRVPTGPLRDALDPATATDEIDESLRILGIETSKIPRFASLPGSLWGAHVVRCTRCEKRRLAIRAFYVDVRRAQQLIAPLLEGTLNNDVCRNCGCHAVFLEYTWLSESQRPISPLGPLACLWRIGDFGWVYQPPNWMPRNPALDVVVEDCAKALLDELDPPHVALADPRRPQSLLIAHSRAELIQYVAGDQPFEDLSSHHAGLIHALTHRLENERIAFVDAYEFAVGYIRASGGEWPIRIVENPGDDSERPMRTLAAAVVAEAAARHQQLRPALRAVLAIATARCLMVIGRNALAEGKLAEAEQHLLSAGELDAIAMQMLVDAHGDLASRQGRHEEALDLRKSAATTAPGGEAPIDERMEYWTQQARIALSLKNTGDREAACAAFAMCIPSLESIAEEYGRSAATSEDVNSARRARRALAGATANFAGLHLEVATDWIAAVRRAVSVSTGPELEAACRDLLRVFGGSATVEDLARAALTLLRHSQEISRDIFDWEFLSAQLFREYQAHALLRDRGGIDSMLPEWLEVARKAESHRHIFLAKRELTLSAWRNGHLSNSLEHLRDAARALLQDELSDVGLDLPSREAIDLRAIAVAIASTPNATTDVIRGGVLVAEALKGFRTGQSLRVGTAGRLASRGDSDLSRLQREREDERSQFKYSDEGTPESDQAERAIDVLDRRIEALRHRRALRDALFQRWCDPADVSLDAVSSFERTLADLGPRTTFIGIELANGGVTVYALWVGGAAVAQIDWPDYDHDLQGVQREMRDGDPTDALRRIALILLPPLKERLDALDPQDHIIISPAGTFFTLPFAALPYKGQLLCEKATISVVHGLSGLRECVARPIQLRSLLAVGYPERDGEQPIPWTLDEANDIQQQFQASGRTTEGLLRGQATIANLCERVPDADVVHLGCHGSWSSGSLGAYLHLTPDRAASDSGDLTSSRIAWELPLRRGALVVIASCDTAIHLDEGDYLTGIVPAFLLAGAGAVVAANWPVNDRQTRAFQRSFYQSLLAGEGVAHALAVTQRACVRGELGDDLRAARHWSAFTAFGVA